MATFMYIRETRFTLSKKEQIEYAKKQGIAEEHLLGPNQYARETCTDIRQLIGAPLKAGDHLVIRNLHLIGSTHQKILDTLQAFHHARICLEIVDARYKDLVTVSGSLQSSNEDYRRIMAFLRVFVNMNEKRKVFRMKAENSGRKRGRPAKTWNTVPEAVRDIVARHAGNLYEYTEERALMDIRATGYSIGYSAFRALKREYKEMTKNRRR